MHGTPESREAYHRVIAEWERGGRQAPPKNADLTVREVALRSDQHARCVAADLSVTELVLAYVEHAEAYYRKGDRLANQTMAFRWSGSGRTCCPFPLRRCLMISSRPRSTIWGRSQASSQSNTGSRSIVRLRSCFSARTDERFTATTYQATPSSALAG